MDERKDTGRNGGFTDGRYRGVGADGGFVLENNAIQLRDV